MAHISRHPPANLLDVLLKNAVPFFRCSLNDIGHNKRTPVHISHRHHARRRITCKTFQSRPDRRQRCQLGIDQHKMFSLIHERDRPHPQRPRPYHHCRLHIPCKWRLLLFFENRTAQPQQDHHDKPNSSNANLRTKVHLRKLRTIPPQFERFSLFTRSEELPLTPEKISPYIRAASGEVAEWSKAALC